MNRAALSCFRCFVLGLLLWVPLVSLGKDWEAADMSYGQGVHAYFSADDDQAERYLTRAIQGDKNDPRPYYFRAMSRLRQGRDLDARRDMETGAAIEAWAPDRYAVGRALLRVQGRHRLLLEDFRRRARLAEDARRDQRNRIRYEQPPGAGRQSQPGDRGPATGPRAPADRRTQQDRRTPPIESLSDPFMDD